jgi:hypothetical protein
LTAAFQDASSISGTAENGNILRESLIVGPNGLLKMVSSWDGNRLVTAFLFGGGN